jgi:hypothetical protein
MRTPKQAPQDERNGEIKPDEHIRALHDKIAEHGLVRRVGDPVVALDRCEHSFAENDWTARFPVRAVMQRVDLDVP